MAAAETLKKIDILRRSPRWTVRFWFLAAVLLWCAIPLSPNTVDSDFWGHVQYGRDLLKHGLPKTATYTFTAEEHRWINHENVAEVTFAWLTSTLGYQAVLVLKCLMGCLVIGLIMKNAIQNQVSALLIAATAMLVAVNLSFYWGMRPQVFSFTFFAIMIVMSDKFLSEQYFRQLGRIRFLATVIAFAALFCLWANSHGGFVAGIAVFGVLTGYRAALALVRRDHPMAVRYAVLLATSAAATLLNPYGIELHLWLIDSLRIPRPEVTEWHPLDLFTDGAGKVWAMILLAVIAWTGTRKHRDWSKIVVLTIVFLQTLAHQRHLPFFAILFGLWVPEHLASTLGRIKFDFPPVERSKYDTPWLAIGPLLALCFLLAYQVGARLLTIEVPYARYPVAAVQFMADQEIEDSIVVTGEWAQYVLAVTGARTADEPGCRVAFDGRFRTCYPQAIVDMHFDFFRGDAPAKLRYRSPESPPPDPRTVLEFRRPNLVLLKKTEKFASDIMRRTDDWSLLYSDRTAELWGRSQVYAIHDAENDPEASRQPVATTVDSAQPAVDPRVAEWPARPIPRSVETRYVYRIGGASIDD